MNDAHDGPKEAHSDPAHKLIISGLVVGGAMITLGPIAGVVGTVSGLIHVFDETSKVAAADKSTILSAGIAESMTATNMGMNVAALGGVIAVICAILLWRRSKAQHRGGAGVPPASVG